MSIVNNTVFFLVFLLICVEVYYQLRFFRSRYTKFKKLRTRFEKDIDFRNYAKSITTNNGIVPGRRGIGYALNPDSFAVYDYAPLGGKWSVQINNVGIRHKTDIDIDNYSGQSIILLGDSVCFGSGVDIEDTFAYKTGQMLKGCNQPYDVFNFAVGGYSVLDNLEHFFFREGLKLNPKMIVYFYTFKTLFACPRTNDALTGFHTEKHPISFLCHRFNLYRYKNKLNYLRNRIGKFIEFLEQRNIQFLLVPLPAFYKNEFYPFGYASSEKYTEAVNLLECFNERYTEHYCRIDQDFAKKDIHKYYRKDRNNHLKDYEVHLSQFGHEFSANLICEKIKKRLHEKRKLKNETAC